MSLTRAASTLYTLRNVFNLVPKRSLIRFPCCGWAQVGSGRRGVHRYVTKRSWQDEGKVGQCFEEVCHRSPSLPRKSGQRHLVYITVNLLFRGYGSKLEAIGNYLHLLGDSEACLPFGVEQHTYVAVFAVGYSLGRDGKNLGREGFCAVEVDIKGCVADDVQPTPEEYPFCPRARRCGEQRGTGSWVPGSTCTVYWRLHAVYTHVSASRKATRAWVPSTSRSRYLRPLPGYRGAACRRQGRPPEAQRRSRVEWSRRHHNHFYKPPPNRTFRWGRPPPCDTPHCLPAPLATRHRHPGTRRAQVRTADRCGKRATAPFWR